ncbi:MAG: hypothetical protein MJE77_13730 [Proteobacteria bacterium]|nr:hypothetical protein [Pseudomonadota bacterium]
MRAVVVVMMSLAISPGLTAGTDDARPAGFDHFWHEARVAVTGSPEIACTHCHRVDGRAFLSGPPDHATCFGDCHGPAPLPRRPGRPYPVPDELHQVCTVCHSPRSLARANSRSPERLAVTYPLRPDLHDHGIALSHKTHHVATRDGRDCATCHRVPDDRQIGRPAGPPRASRDRTVLNSRGSGPAHRRCTSCHLSPHPQTGGDMPSMAQCSRCHVREVGPRSRPYLKRGQYPVGRTFSHRRHLARGSIECRACHVAITEAENNALPAPSMDICGSCHDGKKAFSTVAPHCRRCHTQPAREQKLRPRPGPRYDHRTHRRLLSDTPCQACHRLDSRGNPLPPSLEHAPCSDVGCHHDEFSALEPGICGACHIGIEPWRKLHFDRTPRPDTEFGATFSHRAHLAECSQNATCAGRCETCHRRTQNMHLLRDHRACMGAGCHAKRRGPKPRLGRCEACHELELLIRRREKRLTARWSVRARFRHEPHQFDPRSGSASGQATVQQSRQGNRQQGQANLLGCEACHTGVERAGSMDDIPTPGKASCLPCHNGAIAFKVTGHDCARCHAPARLP